MSSTRPYIRIIEQPQKSLRFRYEVERRTGTIPGASSTSKNKTPCAIQIEGYEGRVAILVSCVTKDEPYRPHPHKLVGDHCKKRGVCSFEAEITRSNPTVSFKKLGVECVKRSELRNSLVVRQEDNVDPFLTGFSHKDHLNCVDLHVVRLCFQVFLIDGNRKYSTLTPVVSNPIYNKKTFPDPDILRLSHCNSFVDGGKNDVILLCTKVDKDDIKVRFYETDNTNILWQDFISNDQMQIYNSTAICFKPPRYKDQNISEPVTVYIQLLRPSDGILSKAVKFEYLPLQAEPGFLKAKRKKIDRIPLIGQLLGNETDLEVQSLIPDLDLPSGSGIQNKVLHSRSQTNQIVDLDLIMPSASGAVVQNFGYDVLPSLSSSGSCQNNLNKSGSGCNVITPSTIEVSCQNSPTVLPSIFITESCQNNLTTSDIQNSGFNITKDLSSGSDINLESASGISKLLDMDCNQIQLEPIHLSSGDLEMFDMDRLSGSLQENLSLNDIPV